MLRYVSKPHCRSCEHLLYNNSMCSKGFAYKNTVTKRKNTLRVKSLGMYCMHPELCDSKGKPRKINRNHIRWWGFYLYCPNNPFSTCARCGSKMATSETMCNSCKKYSQYD